MTAAEVVAILKDVATGGAAVTAAVVAAMGLSTWKRQLHGNAAYERARRMLRATYALREAMRYVRMPVMYVEEMSAALKDQGIDADDRGGARAAYDVRWKKLQEARVEFSAELLEAEVLWGQDIRVGGHDLNLCVGELGIALGHRMSERRLSGQHENKVDDVICDAGTDNEFSARVDDCIAKIESVLRPHLKG